MSRDGLPRPDGANLAGRVVANGKHKIHVRRAGFRKFIPALAAQIRDRKLGGLKLLDGIRIYASSGMASRAVCLEVGPPFLIQDSLGKNRARRVASTKKKDVALHSSFLYSRLWTSHPLQGGRSSRAAGKSSLVLPRFHVSPPRTYRVFLFSCGTKDRPQFRDPLVSLLARTR